MSNTPELPIKAPVLDGLGKVLGPNVVTACEVGNRSRQLEDSIVGARRESELVHRDTQYFATVGRQSTPFSDMAGPHIRILEQSLMSCESSPLDVTRCDDPIPHHLG